MSPKGALSRVRLSGGSSKVRACLRDSLGRVLFPDAAKTTAVVATFTKERGLGGIGILSGSSSHGGFRQRGASQKPSMQIKSFKSTGALASAVTLRVMRMHRHTMLYCFERELQKNPAFAANVSLELRIGADGRVAKFTTKTANRALQMCVEQLVRALRFPKGRGDTVVTQQIEFRSLARTILQKPTATRP